MPLEALATYSPSGVMDAAELAHRSGIPEEILVEKFGFTKKHVSAPDEHVSDMTLRAAEALFAAHPADRDRVGLVIYCGSGLKDYMVWSCSSYVLDALKLTSAYGFELVGNCAGFLMAMWTAQSMMVADPELQAVLLVGASEDSTIIDYSDLATKSVFNFGDGGAAMLLTRDGDGSRVLGYCALTDGEFHDSVTAPAGGTLRPASHQTVDEGGHFLRVKPGVSLRDDVTPMFVRNAGLAGQGAVAKAGLVMDQIDHVLIQNQVPSVFRRIVEAIGADPARCPYFGGHGHMASLDPVFALRRAVDQGAVQDGDYVLLVASGTGYTAAGLVLQWSEETATARVA